MFFPESKDHFSHLNKITVLVAVVFIVLESIPADS